MKLIFITLNILLVHLVLFSQNYQSLDNPYYWKNSKPHEAYWQQDVHYKIKAKINDNTNILDGQLELKYYNNAPDDLAIVYFHLYQNAFLPQSYYAQKAEANGYNLNYGSYQKKGLGTQVDFLSVDGVIHSYEVDNTIMKVELKEPLKAGDSAVFKINFKTYFNDDAGWGRMRLYKMWGFKHFNGAHWYPRMSVYDAKFGWTADQHLVHEFYGDFGTYEVELDFPDNYILEATGMLTNEHQVLPPDLRMKIALTNFADKPFGSPPSVVIPYDSTKRKVWKYRAINVHDFAFVASPTYRIGWVMKDGVRCVAIAHESHAAKWQSAPELTADIIDIFSKKIGPYAYPKMVVADAFSGMEYPMLTMNSGTAPDYAYIIAHEIGHNWFFGMVGSNETYRALLDEGFTQYLTVYALEKLSEKGAIESPFASKYINNYQKKRSLRDRFAYLRYIRHAVKTHGVALNTHSDMFETRSPYGEEYRQTYYKGAAMLFNLEYVLGEELFDKAIKGYFEQWKFCHPYDEDMRASFISSTGVDLNWFFDQFINTAKAIDYKVHAVHKDTAQHTYNIVFKRKGGMHMPLDFTVVDKKDSLLHFYIPNTEFIKKTDALILPKWYGWLHFNPIYTARVVSPHGIKNVKIDLSQRLADVYAPDNSLKKQVACSFDYLINNTEDLHNYELYWRPDLWWNGYEGIKAGINLNGHYLKHFHVFDFYTWFNSGLLNKDNMLKHDFVSFSLDYNTPVSRYAKSTRLFAKALRTEGINRYALQLNHYLRPESDYLYIEVKSLFRSKTGNKSLMLYPNDWDGDNEVKLNNTLAIGYKHFYNKPGRSGYLELKGVTSFLASAYDYNKFSAAFFNAENLDLLALRTRIFAQISTGTHIPSESMLYLAGASPEELIESKFTRSSGFVPDTWGGFGVNTNHFHAGGGLNVRGYAGYLVAEELKSGIIVPAYKGHSGISFNAELEFDKLVTIRPPKIKDYLKLHTYLFADAGLISVNAINKPLEISDLRASAGVGMALTVKKWGNLNKLKPFTLRLDMPLFLNRPSAIDKDFFNYRWIVGIGRAIG